MKRFLSAVFSGHSLDQMARRGISEDQVRKVLDHPEKLVSIREGRIVAQGTVSEGGSSRRYMLRVFLDVDRKPPVVVTAYKTSKLEKYGDET
jgi:hypothetical protein